MRTKVSFFVFHRTKMKDIKKEKKRYPIKYKKKEK